MINDIRRPQDQVHNPAANKKIRHSKKKLIIVIALVVFSIALVGGVAAGWSFFASKQEKDNIDDVSVVVKKVEKHYVLPTDEQPALITVTDKSKVKTEFLRAAENGDKLLVYKEAKKALLYRPSIDRLIEVGPVSLAE